MRHEDSVLGDLVLKAGLVTPEQLASARGEARPLAEVLVEKGWVSPDQLQTLLNNFVASLEKTIKLSRSTASKDVTLPAEVTAAATDPKNDEGKFVLVRLLGKGGMGEVYKAWERALRRFVAVKFVKAGPESLREAQAAARLDHQNIVPVYDVGQASRGSYLVMKYIQGKTLERAPLNLRQKVQAVRDAARAIAYAHGKGVIHRDLKPENILVEGTDFKPGDSPRAYVMDFGLARQSDVQTSLSATGAIAGTPPYMAPEQARGAAKEVDERTDVYALGATLYSVLTGVPPFAGDEPIDVLERVLKDEPLPPRQVNPSVPKDLETIALKCLEKAKARRYSTATDLADELQRYLDGETIRARPVPWVYRMYLRVRKKPALYALGTASALALVIAVIFGFVSLDNARRLREKRDLAAQMMREKARITVNAALQFRRIGARAEMKKLLPELMETHRQALEHAPDVAEIDYWMGRFHRALMEDENAASLQDRALAKDAEYAPALYERLVINWRALRRHIDDLVEREWGDDTQGLLPSSPSRQTSQPSREELAKRDAKARDLMSRLKDDLRRLSQIADRRGGLAAGELDCARGLLALMEGNYPTACDRLTSAIQASPDLEEGYEALATLEMERKDFEKSVRWWSEGLERDHGYIPHREGRAFARTVWAYVKTAQDQASLDLCRGAVEDLTEVLAWEPHRARTLHWRGLAGLVLGGQMTRIHEDALSQIRSSIDDFTSALKEDPRAERALMWRGVAWSVLALFSIGRGADPTDFSTHALEDFDSALKTNPSWVEAWTWRAIARGLICAHKLNRGEDPGEMVQAANADLDEAVKRRPEREEPWMWRGVVRMSVGYFELIKLKDPTSLCDAALSDFNEALRLNANRAEIYLRRGQARGILAVYEALRGKDATDRYSSAMSDFDEALKRDDRLAEAMMWRGMAQSAWGSYQLLRGKDPRPFFRQGISDLDGALKLDPNIALAWQLRGDAHEKLAGSLTLHHEEARPEYEAALRDYTMAVKINPGLEPSLKDPMAGVKRKISAK